MNERRPPLLEALRAEGSVPPEKAMASLEAKGYFTPRPRPWRLGYCDRGFGHGTHAVLDRFGDPVAEHLMPADAELIIKAVNAYKE
ncbi:MAG: hypothetical protein WC702_02640 [Patescibacteria group bacterium]